MRFIRSTPKKNKNTQPKTKTIPEKPEIPESLIIKCKPALIEYGFTNQEAEILLSKAYTINNKADCIELIKIAIQQNIGE